MNDTSYNQARAAWRERWYRDGYFGSDDVAGLLQEAVQRHPDTPFYYYRSAETTGDTACIERTSQALWRESEQVARGLWAEGVRPRDVVAVQMPTWHETVLVYLAAFRVGAVVLPIVHIYGPRELGFILAQSGATSLVIPDRWHKIDFIQRFRDIGPLPDLERVIVVGDEVPPGMVDWQTLRASEAPAFTRDSMDPDEPCTLIYTSGTTSSPKGVLYSSNNLRSEWQSPFFATPGPYLCNFPAGHVAGFNFVLRPLIKGIPVVYFDHWNAERVARAIDRHGVRETGGNGFFLRELLRAREQGFDLSSIEYFSLGGTGVTPAEVRLAEAHGFTSGRSYGSTEHSTVSLFAVDASAEQRASTDGRILPGVQVRIVDDDGKDLPPGERGEILTQGPELFIGYKDPALNEETFRDGWYCTGDIGFVDDEGFLTISDRKKDIIIRAGENIASKEVEDILNDMAEVVESAVTAMPDERYGEKVCAFLRLRPGATLDLEQVRAFFSQAGVARQKTPEKLIMVDDFPRTPAGKIKKVELRALVRGRTNSDDPD